MLTQFILQPPNFTQNKENKIAKAIKLVVDIPFAIVYLALNCTLPAVSILMGFMFMAIFAIGIPLLIMIAVKLILQIDFTYPTYVFGTVSVATILCAHCSKFMFGLLSRFTPLRDWGDHKHQKLSLDLALYVLHKKNITFLIYFVYFVFLAITGFKQIQYDTYLISSEIDAAVTKAFLVFLAYTNMLTKSSEVDIDSKELLVKIVRLMLSDDKEESSK